FIPVGKALCFGSMSDNANTVVLPHVEIYTDGGCEPNPGPGGSNLIFPQQPSSGFATFSRSRERRTMAWCWCIPRSGPRSAADHQQSDEYFSLFVVRLDFPVKYSMPDADLPWRSLHI
ncbi:MAG TPA: hypothetical protein VKA67_06685, partial [Verrucomicrobiae bacterium]|nr:hypothetical protein [Verrucomicrobiae bacterium]